MVQLSVRRVGKGVSNGPDGRTPLGPPTSAGPPAPRKTTQPTTTVRSLANPFSCPLSPKGRGRRETSSAQTARGGWDAGSNRCGLRGSARWP